MDRHGIVFRRFFILYVAFWLAAVPSCAPVQTKSARAAAETTSNSEEKKQSPHQMTEAELQSEVMSFADRFATILAQSSDTFEGRAPTFRARYIVLGDTVYSQAAAFTIAGGPNPQVAMLDLVALTTLGRMIYEEHYLVEFGEPAEVMVRGFKTLEADAWQIAAKVLSPEQQQELRDIIRGWRQDHPEQLFFSHLRFSDFAAARGQSTLVKAVESGGMFGSVKKVTKEVEETRMLAERGIFLASRMPLLTGGFGDVWLSKWILNPELQKLVGDVHTFSKVSERLATVAEQLPDHIALERRNLIRDLESQEKALSQTMREAKGLISLVNETAQTVATVSAGIDKMLAAPGEGRRPFDIMDYYNTVSVASDTVKQVSVLLDSAERLLGSPNWEQPMPGMFTLANGVASEGKGVITHTFLLGIALMLIFFLGMFILIRYAARQFAGLRKE
jgi:hypothetical protein